jgi:hypothetical protein
MTTYGLELLYPDLCPVAIHWKSNSSAWLTVKHENRIELARPGLLGMEIVKPFLEDDSKLSIASNNGITKEAANIEMLSSQEYHDLHRAHGAVRDRNVTVAVNGNADITPVEKAITPDVSSPIATGGLSYDGTNIFRSVAPFYVKVLIVSCSSLDFEFEIPASLKPSNTEAAEIIVSAKRGYVDLDTPESSDTRTTKKQHR